MTGTDCTASKSLSITQLCGLGVLEERRKLALLSDFFPTVIVYLRDGITTCLYIFFFLQSL